jgi:hypothetical protein
LKAKTNEAFANKLDGEWKLFPKEDARAVCGRWYKLFQKVKIIVWMPTADGPKPLWERCNGQEQWDNDKAIYVRCWEAHHGRYWVNRPIDFSANQQWKWLAYILQAKIWGVEVKLNAGCKAENSKPWCASQLIFLRIVSVREHQWSQCIEKD